MKIISFHNFVLESRGHVLKFTLVIYKLQEKIILWKTDYKTICM